MTSSIEFAFGSQQMVRGFLLNNQLTEFSFVAEQQVFGLRVIHHKTDDGAAFPGE
jgi:gamma-glutamyltranspeptidase